MPGILPDIPLPWVQPLGALSFGSGVLWMGSGMGVTSHCSPRDWSKRRGEGLTPPPPPPQYDAAKIVRSTPNSAQLASKERCFQHTQEVTVTCRCEFFM